MAQKAQSAHTAKQAPKKTTQATSTKAVSSYKGVDNAALTWYRQYDWGLLWDKFVYSTLANGVLAFPNVREFIDSEWTGSSKDVKQARAWAWMVVGPEPTAESRKKLILPWLGDWEERRKMGLWATDKSSKALSTVLSERTEALELAKGVASISLDWIARFQGLSKEVDKFFKGQLFIEGLSNDKLEERMNIYLGALERISSMSLRHQNMFLESLGLKGDDISILAQLTAAGGQAALRGVAAGVALTASESTRNKVVNLMNETFHDKAKAFGYPLLDQDVARKEKVIEAKEEKRESKVHA